MSPTVAMGTEFLDGYAHIPVAQQKKVREFRDTSLNSTIPELSGSGWLAAEPEATPQTHRLRPWGFPTVSPSHPSVLPIMGYNESRWSSARSLPLPLHQQRQHPSRPRQRQRAFLPQSLDQHRPDHRRHKPDLRRRRAEPEPIARELDRRRHQ